MEKIFVLLEKPLEESKRKELESLIDGYVSEAVNILENDKESIFTEDQKSPIQRFRTGGLKIPFPDDIFEYCQEFLLFVKIAV